MNTKRPTHQSIQHRTIEISDWTERMDFYIKTHDADPGAPILALSLTDRAWQIRRIGIWMVDMNHNQILRALQDESMAVQMSVLSRYQDRIPAKMILDEIPHHVVVACGKSIFSVETAFRCNMAEFAQ